MAFDANKMRELMESKPARQESISQPAEESTTWVQDRTAELNAEIQDSTPEETYTFDPEESRANFEGIGALVSNTFQNIARAETDYVMAEQGGDEEEIERARVNAMRAPFKEGVRQFTAAYADDNQSPFQTFAQGLRQSSANIEYFMTDDEKLKQAREIEKTLHIPAAATLTDTETMQNAMSAYDYARKIQAAGGSMEQVYRDYPKLKEIAQMDPQGAALALKDLHNIHEVRDIASGWAAFWKSGNDSYDYGVLKAKDAMEGLTDEEKARADELKKAMENAPVAPSFFVNPALAMLSGVQSLPEMIYSSANALPYAVTGGVIGAAAVGAPTIGVGLPAGALAGFKKGFDVGLFIEMARPMMGRKYAEYQAMTDENGNRLFTDAQAREWAIAETIPEAFVEVASFKYGAGKTVLGEHAKKAVADAMRGVTKPTAGKAFLDLLFGAGKGVMETGVSETIEEGTQGAISDVFDAAIKNAAEKGNGDFTFSGLADTMGEVSWSDIGKRAIAQGLEAAPGAFFLGGISSVGGAPMGGVRYGLERRAWTRQWGEMAKVDRTTLSGTIMLEQLQKTVHDSKLQDTAPDVQREIIRDELKDTPWKMAYIDVKYALQNEGGLENVREVGRAAGKSDEEIEQAIENEGILSVPLESYAQSAASPELLDSVSFSPDADPLAKIRDNAKKANEDYTRRVAAEVQKQIDLTEAMTKELFPEKQEQDAAMFAIYQNPENPAQGWKELHDKAVADLDEILAPALSALERGMGQGTSVVETMNDQGDVSTGRVSNNEEWYSKFYAEHKRKPNKEERREMAKKMMTGEPDAPQVQGWTVSDKETAEMMANEKDRLAAAEQEIRILDSIKERMQELNGKEIQLTAGMTPEAYKVYRTINSSLRGIGGKQARAARVGALITARHADVIAKRMQGRGLKNYTALDYIKDLAVQKGTNAAMAQEAYNQLAVNTQMEEVRRQYEGTDQWMKAPNGEPTNLTEEQWLIVRTPAFKNWFGDWEKSKKDRSKVLDENGEPKVVHHGTGRADRVGSVFLPERATSGPMAFFTDSFDIATNYSKNKQDTSLSRDEDDYREYKNQFTVQIEGRRNPMKIGDAWWYLPKEQQKKIAELAPAIGHDENEEIAIIPGNTTGLGGYDYHLKQFHGNHMKALIEEWLESGSLFNQEEEFLQVLKLAGLDNVQYNDPYKREEAVYSVFLNIRKPFDATNINKTMLKKLEAAARKAQKTFDPQKAYNADSWDKTSMPPETWIEHVHDDIKNGTTYAWTVVPDFVTETLQKAGYDGIQDLGGKGGGEGHTVYIPFASTQIKSATDNNGQFAVDNPDIYQQITGENGKTETVGFSLDDKEAIKSFAEALTYENIHSDTIPQDLMNAISTSSNQENLARAVQFLSDQRGEVISDPLGNQLYYEPGNDETLESYALHLIAGNEAAAVNDISKIRDKRVIGLLLSRKTLENPMAIIIQKAPEGKPEQEDRRVYLSVYRGDFNLSNSIVIGVEEGQDGRVVTTMIVGRKDKKKAALNDLKNHLSGPRTKKVLYIRAGLSGYSRPTTEDQTSQGNTSLGPSGTLSIPKENKEGNTKNPTILDILNQSAWHGSRALFNEFDLGYIGTGEGAQVHGYGVYVGKNKAIVEKRYKERLSKGELSLDGKPLPDLALDSEEFGNLPYTVRDAAIRILSLGSVEKAVEALESQADFARKYPWDLTKEEKRHLFATLNLLKSGRISFNNGYLYEVEIPDNDVLLDEQKTFSEQPEKVQEALKKLVDDYFNQPIYYEKQGTGYAVYSGNREIEFTSSEDQAKKAVSDEKVRVENSKESFLDTLEYADGRAIYKDLSSLVGSDRSASELLNQYGIEGITYDGRQDGRCFVIFNDQAISIINRFNQEMNGGIQGQTLNYLDGRRIVQLFETADESTFLHELGHIFLLDLQRLAEMGDEESIADLETVNSWAEWHDGDAAKYKNTPWAQEFEDREKAIREAQKNGVAKMPDGTTKTEAQLLREWKQERFARAFEIYLKEGKAPSKGLRKVFQDFVKFLEQVYVALVSDGARASAQVEAVMGRLIATDEEIEAAEQDERYKDFMQAGGEKLMYEDAAETFSRWHEEAKEEARDKLRRIVMRSLTGKLGKKRKEILREERARKEEELSNQPVYLARQAEKETGIKDAWRAYFPGEEGEANWKAADNAAPPIEEAVDAYMRDFEANLDKKEVQDVLTEEAIEEAMSTARSHEKLLRMEQRAFARKAALANNLSVKARTRLEDVERWIDKMPDDGDDKDLGSWHKAITSLKVSNRWTKEELDAIDQLSVSASKESAKENFEALRKIIKDRKVGLADLREANKGRIEILRKMAKETIGRQTLAQATQVQTHRKEEKEAAKEAEKLAKKEKWAEAAAAKERELLASFMASESEKVRNRQDALLKRIRTQLNAKTKLPKDERYWHQHLAYLLRVTDKDAAKPEGLKSLSDIAKTLGDGLDVATDDEGRSNILDLMQKLTDENAYQDGYHGMRLSEFEDAADVLTVLYTTGRDKYNLKLTQGKTIGEAVDEILQDTTAYNGAEVRRSTVTGNPNRGGVFWSETLERIPGVGDALAKYAQRYGLSLTKPEELINLLGKRAHKYIYDAYDRAAENEAAMTAQFCGTMEEILSSHYKPEEMREWQARKYSWHGQPISKENILAMAMNLGNEINADRLIMGMEANPAELMKFISDHMTEKDWLFCQDVWDLLQTYWPDTVRVEMELNGTRLKPQEARPFTVKTTDAKGNEIELNLRGGYYPIKYDPELSTKSKEQSENAEAQSGMSGAVVFGMGRGFTKDRAGKGAVKQRPLLLDLSVIPEHVGEVVHNITTRIAARDVYRIINNGDFRDHVVNTLGQDAYGVLLTWATDVWKIKPEQKNSAENLINGAIRRLRQNSGIAIMGYRMWPTIENATNIFPMMDALGAAETLSAMGDYYANRKKYDELIAKSLFMKERTERMDRDMKGQRGMFQRQNAVSEWLVKHAYDPITYTDLLTSKPLWARSYKNAFPKMLEEVREENEENAKTFENRRAEYDKINATIIDMKKRRLDMQNELRRRDRREAVLAETDLTRMSRSTLRDEIHILDGEIEDKGKTLFVAGEKMERASTLVIRTEQEILKESEHRAILAADKAVRDVIGSGDVKDLSEVQRSKNEAVKALTMFYSYFNTQANAIIAAHWKGKWQGGQGYNFLPLAKAIAYRFLLTSALSTAMRWLFFNEGNDDKDKYKKDKEGNKIEVPALERALKQYAKNALSTTVGGAYGLREIANWAINRYIDGQTYGGGARFDGMYGNFVNQVLKEAELISNKYARDEKAREEEEKRQERYRHMTPAQRKKFREEEKYRRPPNTISYADILRGAGSIGTSLTAGTLGVTEPIANAVLGTMQYIFDSDGRYDATLSNMMWSAFWTKKPVKRTPPEKPKKQDKKGR